MLLKFFFLFIIIYLYFLILAVIARIFNPIVELVISVGIASKEAKAKIQKHIHKFKYIQ